MRSQVLKLIPLLTLFLAPAAQAETRQHGNLIFDIPTGWTSGVVSPDGTLTLLSDLPMTPANSAMFTCPAVQPGPAAPRPGFPPNRRALSIRTTVTRP